jgi:hypothetical protein
MEGGKLVKSSTNKIVVICIVMLYLIPASNAFPVGTHATPETTEKAKAFFQAGAQAYDAGRFEAAVQAFEAAWKHAPLPAILFSMAQAERKQYYLSQRREYLDRALAHYRDYAEASSARRRSEAVDGIAELEAISRRLPMVTHVPETSEVVPLQKARLMVTTQAPKATVTIDDGAPGEAPFIGDLDPGRHRILIAAEGFFPKEREVELVLGSTVGIDLPLAERAGALSIDAPSGSEVYVDGLSVGKTPFYKPVDVVAGKHVIAVVGRGIQAWTNEVVVERGKAVSFSPVLVMTTQRKAAYGIFGAAGAAMLSGAVCTLVAYSRQHTAESIQEEQKQGNISAQRLEDYSAAVQSRNSWKTAAEATLGTGVGLAAVGAVLYVFDRPTVDRSPAFQPLERKSSLPEFSAVPTILPDGVAMNVMFRF